MDTVGRFAGDSNQNLCTYLNLAPNVETENEIKLVSLNLDSLNTVAKNLKTENAPFNPHLNEFGIIKSNSNLTKLNRGYETKYFVASHRRSDFTKFLVTKLHFQFNPVSFTAVKVSTRNHNVILGLGTFYAQIKISCPQYKKLRDASMKQQRAPLPERRVNCQMNPFEHVGINYARPFKVKAILKIALPSQDSTCLEKISRRSYPTDGTKEEKCIKQPNLHEQDVVMEMDDSLPRGAWRLLRVHKVLPGDDGKIRKVEVINSAGKTYLRPIHRLIPIVLE